MLQKLYKLDSKNKIRSWTVETKDNGDGTYSILVSHGLDGGIQQVKETLIKKGKNIGKSNETTVEEQAKSEAESKWNKQKDKGYTEDPNPTRVLLPMLAHTYDKHSKKIIFPAVVQPKLDGLRCLIYYDGVVRSVSRLGKEWKVIQHIEEELIPFFESNPDIVLDGELYSTEITFQDICSAIKRDEPSELTPKVKFYCYDCYDSNNPNLSFLQRYRVIEGLDLQNTIVVKNTEVNNKSEINEVCEELVKLGYEGGMVRNTSGVYKVNGRSYDLQKVKKFDDQEFEIVSMTLDKNGECVFTCLCDNGQFDVKPEGSHEERKAYYNQDNIGKMLNVRFFGFTDDGIPRFPIGVYIREGC